MQSREAASQSRVRILASTISCLLAGSYDLAVAQEEEQAELEEVVVTGSRIVRRDFTAPSPILTVEQEQFENISTIGVETALNQFPQFVPGTGTGAPGAGTQFGTTDVQSTAGNTPGISVLNLRGLGPNRNLVLVNGRRAQPANANLVVDVNTIPAAAIQSVEVITGGASAVYGADAIGGVVNFILRDDFEGVAFDVQSSGTEEGGGEETRFSALVGGNFAGGGNAMVGMEWAQRHAVSTLDRDFYIEGFTDPGTPAPTPSTISRFDIDLANAPDQAVVDSLFPEVPAGSVNVMPGAPTDNFYFNDDGSAFVARQSIGYQGPVFPETLQFRQEASGDLAENFLQGLISSPLERYSIFARSTFDLSENVNAFVQGNFTSVQVDQVLQYSPSTLGWGAAVPNDGREIPADLQTLLDSRPDPTAPWALTRDLDFLGPRTSENRNRMFQIIAGVEGELGIGDWTYEGYYAYGETSVKNALGGFASTGRLTTILEAPNWGEGFVNAENAFLGFQATCTTGLPVFEDFQPSQDCVDAVTINMTNTTEMEQEIVEANFQGRLADLPAGELRAAFGVSTRRNFAQFTPDPAVDAEQTVDLPVGLFASNDAGGETDVDEIYGELLLPITQRFGLELGLRSSDYNTTGRIETYKALFDWAATDRVRFRGGRQIANRAPNTAELFQGRTQMVVGMFFSDPCAVSTIAPWGNVPGNPNRDQVQTLCSAIINAPPGEPSNFDLDPDNFDTFFGFFPFELEGRTGNTDVGNEEAETYTFGLVWSANNWTLAADWYDIEISDAIAAPSAETIYEQCFNADGTSNPTYSLNDPGGFCNSIVRDPASGGRLQVNTAPINIGGIRTSGVDVQLNWNGDVGPGNLGINFLVNWLDKYETTDTPTSPFEDAAGTLAEGGQYDYRIFTTLNYAAAGDWGVGARIRHLPSADAAASASNPNTTILGVDSYQIVDLFGNYRFNDSISLRAGIDNVFNPDPEIVGENPGVTNARGSTNPGVYDVLGRRAWLGVNVAF